VTERAALAYDLFEEQRIATDAWLPLSGPRARGRSRAAVGPQPSVKEPFVRRHHFTSVDSRVGPDKELETTIPMRPVPRATKYHLQALPRRTPCTAPTDASGRSLRADLEKLGSGYDDVVAVLEDEGVQKFEAS